MFAGRNKGFRVWILNPETLPTIKNPGNPKTPDPKLYETLNP
jgi:hypothetical protein